MKDTSWSSTFVDFSQKKGYIRYVIEKVNKGIL